MLSTLQLTDKATDSQINAALNKLRPGLTLAALKQDFTRTLPEDQLRDSLYAQKLQASFRRTAQAKATEEAVRKSYSDIQVRHILIKFGEGALPEDQARTKAQKILDAIKADPAQMTKLAKENSDDPGSKETGGFYDWVPASRYVPAFTEAALSVKPGAVYPELVRVANPGYSGFHIVKLEGSKPGAAFPKDFDKEKKKYIDQYVEQTAGQMAQEAAAAALPTIPVTVEDPLLRATQMQLEARSLTDKTAREAKLNQALAELAKVKPDQDFRHVTPYLKASIYEALEKPKEAITAYEEALRYGNSVQTRLALAQIHLKAKDKAKAVTQIEAAEALVRGDINSQFQVATLYREAGRSDLAKAADTRAQEMLKRQAQLNAANTPPGSATLQETGAGEKKDGTAAPRNDTPADGG